MLSYVNEYSIIPVREIPIRRLLRKGYCQRCIQTRSSTNHRPIASLGSQSILAVNHDDADNVVPNAPYARDGGPYIWPPNSPPSSSTSSPRGLNQPMALLGS